MVIVKRGVQSKLQCQPEEVTILSEQILDECRKTFLSLSSPLFVACWYYVPKQKYVQAGALRATVVQLSFQLLSTVQGEVEPLPQSATTLYHPNVLTWQCMILEAVKATHQLPTFLQSDDRINFSFGVGAGSFVKYGWFKHWEAVNRLFGSKTSMERKSDIQSCGAAINISSNWWLGGQLSHSNPRVQRGRVLWSGQFVSVGVPNTSNILSSWLISVWFPCRKGRLRSSSAKIQPTLQISAADEYSEAPSRSSGGLYHKVIACGDSRVFGVPYILARPKSANFIVPSFKKRQLSGFKSLQ